MPEKKDDDQQHEQAEPVAAHEQLLEEEHAAPQPRRNGDHDQETWTNQPAGASGAREEEPLDDIEDEEEEHQPAPRKVIQNGRDVLCEELPDRALRAKLRLKPYLSGAMAVELTNSGERFLFDWRNDDPKVTPLSKESTVRVGEGVTVGEGGGPSFVDCIISLSEQNLMAIRSGDLNPQVAMLADKIKVAGKVGPAVYLFNLVAPRVRT